MPLADEAHQRGVPVATVIRESLRARYPTKETAR